MRGRMKEELGKCLCFILCKMLLVCVLNCVERLVVMKEDEDDGMI